MRRDQFNLKWCYFRLLPALIGSLLACSSVWTTPALHSSRASCTRLFFVPTGNSATGTPLPAPHRESEKADRPKVVQPSVGMAEQVPTHRSQRSSAAGGWAVLECFAPLHRMTRAQLYHMLLTKC